LDSDRDRLKRELSVLNEALGMPVGVAKLPEERVCCGYPMHADGHHDLLQEHLPPLLQALSVYAEVLVSDPGCHHTLTRVADTLLPEDRPRPRVRHVVEALADHAEVFVGRAAGQRLRYHDPCHLGRHGQVYDPPRDLLRAATGQAPLEFGQCRGDADCSGGGGLFAASQPDAAREVARRRLEEDPNAHIPVEAVVTACPSARRALSRSGHSVYDIVDLLVPEHPPENASENDEGTPQSDQTGEG
jgi:Fe-S oxidoreductase